MLPLLHFASNMDASIFTFNKLNEIQESNEFNNCTLFNCRGEVNVKQIHFPNDSYVKCYKGAQVLDITLKPSSSINKCCETYLFGKRWDCGSVLYKHLDILFKMASQELMQIEEGAKLYNSLGTNAERISNKSINYKNSRHYCIELYLFIQNYIKSLCSSSDFAWMLQHIFPLIIKKMSALQRQLKRLTDLPDYVYLHGCNSSGNKIAQPSYHLLHVHLDLRWLNITLLFYFSKAKEYLEFNVQNDSSFTQQYCDLSGVYKSIQQLIFELFDIIIKRYEKIEISSLCKKSPFVCTCIQELWALLQILSDSLCKNNIGKKFWDFLSDYINCMNGFQNNLAFFDNDNSAVYSNLSCTSRIICSLWAIYSIAKLYKLADYDVISCYPLLEDLLKAIGTEDVTESVMRTSLIFIEKICIDIWEPKVEPIVILWEYFQKKLNNHFYIAGATPDSLAIVSKNARGLLNQIKSFLQDVNSVRDSFQHFLRILGLHLEKTKDSPKHWRLIKARIFTKLSPANVATLSQIGEYHFVSLFLTMALTLGYTQVGNKMIDLGNLSKNARGSLNVELIKGQLAFVLIILENDGNAENAIKPIVEHVSALSAIEHIDTLRLVAEAMQDILESHECMTQGQYLLIDGWLLNYLSCCSTTESTKVLATLLRIIKRHKQLIIFQKPEPQFLLFINKLWGQLEPYLSTLLASTQLSIPAEALELAAALAMLYHNFGSQETFKNIFSLFLCREVADVSMIRRFLCHFIEYFGMNNILPSYNKIIIKAWLRCCFFCDCKENPEMRQFTAFILTIPEIRSLFDGCEESLNCLEDPLLVFFICLQNKYTTLEDIYRKQAIREKLCSYVEGLENWVKPVICNPRNTDQVKRLYNTVGNMFRLAAPLLYVKSKPNTLLQQLIDQLLLPFAVHNPDTKIHENIISAIKLYLHLFIQGLMQLSPEEDHYILRILKELITIYVPRCIHLSSVNGTSVQTTFSLVGEFKNFDHKLKTFILKTVCNIFLKRKARRPSDHAIFGLIFIREIMKLHGKYDNVFSCLITCTFERVCDVIMYCDGNTPEHRSAKEIMKLFLNNNSLRINNIIMEDVRTALTVLTNENLAWSSRQLFELMTFLSLEAPDVLLNFLPKLLELIKEVELKRGVGYDKTLRMGFEKIENHLNVLTRKLI